ncbi:ABC transporter permease [Actinoplanes sp. NBRC 103695]|uniref:ABC transporter permease n=1 Tax=Actinoplanes sp. NBRC 103695 TaxID=3032202 RepID=UPI0024A1DB86|nr:ABC transporter permease [Actinoplanes sp. NBRC 103695]GLZ01190.1 ABC transporter permease [Actinoplanes sp. NBRC 103695]
MTPLPRTVRLSPWDLGRLGLLGIRTRPGRVGLSAFGIAIGIATMIAVTAIPASGQRALMDQLSALGTNLLQASPQETPQGAVPFPPESVDMVARIGPVSIASAVANTHTKISRSDRNGEQDFAGIAVLATRLNLPEALHLRLRAGRFLNQATAALPTVVLGADAAIQLGFDHLTADPPPQVFIGGRWFTVIGILEPIPLAPDIDSTALVGWPAAESQLGFDGQPTVIYTRAAEAQIDAVREVMARTINPAAPGSVTVSRPSDALAAKRATESTLSTLFLGLAAVALLVGGIGVANTMVVAVLERRHEIGLRRALGASRGQVRIQFVIESVVMAFAGGGAGLLLGVAATIGYARYQHWPVVIPLASAGIGLGAAVVIGAVAGLYPAVRAARLSPTEALAG